MRDGAVGQRPRQSPKDASRARHLYCCESIIFLGGDFVFFFALVDFHCDGIPHMMTLRCLYYMTT